MARITEDLIRKCAEHNECEIFSLEELSLHQRNIIKLEHLDRWCRDLKILYLHNNLISKIENLGRLKKLEYINFTLNNITRIENLEGCESLKKLDFTVNFIGELTSVESLKENIHLEELYLTGNPCVDYEGYREFVLAALPQLKILDGENIKPSQRISALQKYYSVRRDILEQQARYMKKIGKTDEEIRILTESLDKQDEVDESSKTQDNFWKEPARNTPQTRIEIYKQLEKSRYKDKKSEEKKLIRPKRFFTDDGRPLNINEPKLDFEFTDEEENNCYKLDLGVYRYLSTCSIDVDVQPNYVRVLVKGKVFQLHLPKEVKLDSCTSLRSQVTGHLLITMPKVEDVLKSKIDVKKKNEAMKNQTSKKENNTKLEVTSGLMQSLSSIVIKSNNNETREKKVVSDEMPAEEFEEIFDDAEIPPLI